MSQKRLNVGIIGCGDIANNKHMPALKELSKLCKMTSFCDIRINRAVKAAEEFGDENSKVYEDYQKLLKDESIDLVHVLTPNDSHSPITVAALQAGKHVMCEKPMAHNKEAADKMIKAWQQSDQKFTIGYQFRFREDVQKLKRDLKENKLGEIYCAKAHALRRKAVPAWGVFLDKDKQGGGPLIDIGTHSLDLTLWLMDNYQPQSISGSVFNKMNDETEGNLFGPWQPENYEVEDSAFGFIKMTNGALIFLESAWVLNTRDPKEASATFYGTKAGAEIRWSLSDDKSELIYNMIEEGKYKEVKESSVKKMGTGQDVKNSLGYKEAKSWLKAIIDDREPVVKPEEAYMVTKILDAIYKSAAEDKEIKFSN